MLLDSAITCKTRWNNIRDNYRKSLKKRVTRSGLTGQLRNMRYKYENQLTFLLPFIRERDSNHSGPIREGDEMSTVEETPPPVKRDDNHGLQTRPADNSEVTEDETNRYGEEQTARNEQPRREIPIENDSGLIIPELTSWNYPAENNDLRLQVAASSQSHSVDAFLASIAPTLKSLSPYHLNITKTKIFSIVQEVEMVQIVKRQKRHQARKRRAASSPDESSTSSFSNPMFVSSMSP